MTNPAQIFSFIPRDYDIFGGLDVDIKSMAITFTDHGSMQKSSKLPYSASQLLSYTRKHFPGQRVAFVYEAGPTGFGLHDELTAANHPCFSIAGHGADSLGQRETNRLTARTRGVGGDNCAALCAGGKLSRLRHLYNCATPRWPN